MITQEYLKSLFNYNPETGLFTQTLIRAQRKKIGTIDSKGYLRIGIDGKYYRAHRLAFLYMTGKFPENQVDHKNTIRLDNSWNNLREANNAQNQYNRHMKNKTGFKGVALVNGFYTARIRYKKKRIHIGSYKTAEEAAKAYNNAAEWMAEDFKRLD